MKNRKKIACLALTAAMAVSCMGAGTALAFADTGAPDGTETATQPATTWANPDWKDGSGDPSATYDSVTGLTHIEGLTSGASSTYGYKVHLDGLEVHYKIGREGTRNTSGFAFSDLETCTTETEPWHTGASFGMTVWPKTYRSPGQTRVYFGKAVTDQEAGNILYKDQNLETKGFGSNACYISGNDTDMELKLTFHKLSVEGKDVWSIDVEPLMQVKPVGGTSNDRTGYFDGSNLNGVLDENGDAYFVALGYTGDEGTPNDCYFALKDNNSEAYKTGALKTAEDTVEAYKTAIEAVTDEQTFTASQTARATAVAGLESIRGNDKIILQAKIEEYDKLYTSDESVQANVKTALQTSFTAATAAVNTLKGETEATAVTQENITAANTAIDTARTNYNSMKNMLTAENDEEFTGLLAGYDYELAYAKAKLWVMNLEAQNAAIEEQDDAGQAATLIGAAESYNDGYANSDAKAFIDNVAQDADKTTFEARVTAAQNKLEELKETKIAAVKEFYLTPFTQAVEKDLAILSNITDAKGKLLTLQEKAAIEETDGELYTRYTAAYTKLKDAAEAYVNGQIAQVDTALDTEYDEYTAYNKVRNNFNKINLNLLLEENATITAAYNALKTKKEAQLLDAFGVTSQSGNIVLEQNYTGIYYENDGLHPSRLNYNKPLDLTAGVKIEIELTQIWCTDCGDGENEGRSNNFVFNFLGGPNEYKGKNDADQTPANSGGFCLYIWMFDGNCNVQILDPAWDTAVPVQSQLSTPSEGSVLTIEVKYGDYIELDGTNRGKMWQIVVNEEAELNFTEQQLIDAGMTSLLDDEGKATGYFSVGTYANEYVTAKYPDRINAFTLISINDETFAKTAPDLATATVTATKTSANVGESVTINSSYTPTEAIASTYEWYVNGQKQTATGRNFALKGETAGTYTVYCKINGVKSNEVQITFAAASATEPGGEEQPGGSTTDPGTTPGGSTTDPGTTPGGEEEDSGCGSTIYMGVGGAVAAVLVVAAVGIVIFARKRKHE